MAEDYRSTAQRLSSGQSRLADSFGQQQTTPEGGIGLLSTALGPARYGASAAIRSFDDIRNLLGVLSTANKTNPVRKLIANDLAAAEVAKRLAQPTALNAAKRATALVPVAGAMQAGSDPLGPLPPGMRPPAPYIKEAIPGRPGTEVGVGMPLPPLKQKMDQANATGTPSVMPYVEAGTDQAQNARERSFLERMAQSGLLSTLQGMARAERQYGVGPLAAFSESALDVQAARSAAQQKAAEAQLELAKEQIKAQPKPPKPSAEITKLYDRMRSNKNSLNFLDKIKQYMDKGVVTGGANAALNSIVNFAALFNINLGKTEGQKVDTLVKRLRAQLIASKAFGREANKQEIKLIEKIIPDAGIFTNVDQLREAYALLQEQAEGDARQVSGLLENVYGLPSYSQAVPDNIPAFTRPNKR